MKAPLPPDEAGRLKALHRYEILDTGSEPEFDMGAGVLIVAIALVVIAWLAPTPAAAVPAAAHLWQDLNQPLDSARTRISNMLAAIESGTRGATEIYGNSLSLGVNARQGTDEVFSVTPPSPDFPRYYWRMRVYDTYQAGNWLSSPGFTEAFSSEQADLVIPAAASARVGDFLIRWKTSPTILLAIPSQPVWVSRTGQIQLADAGPNQVDVLSWHTDLALLPGDQYTARAILIDPSVPDLRRAGTDYPAWVKAHYLQTPDNLPQDIRALAKSLTQAQSTPYDKTDAITTYLRREITYSLSVPSLPAGVEPLERFLFTWKSGFCNYYASAEVMLLRSAGVPARLAVGYAQGALQSNGTFVIQERDSHAWPEVYFPGIGWVNFEPTTSQPAIVRTGERTNQGVLPTQATAGPNVRPPVKRLQEDQNPAGRQTAFPYQTVGVWVIILILASIVAYYLRVLDRKKPLSRRLLQWVRQISMRYGINMPTWMARWERWSESTEVERAFQAINQSLGWLGKPQPLHATPAERAEQLKQLLPSLAEQVDILNGQLEQTLFSPTPGDPAKAVQAAWMRRSERRCSRLARMA